MIKSDFNKEYIQFSLIKNIDSYVSIQIKELQTKLELNLRLEVNLRMTNEFSLLG